MLYINIVVRALILFIQTLALYKSFTYLLTYLHLLVEQVNVCHVSGVCKLKKAKCKKNQAVLHELCMNFMSFKYMAVITTVC